MGPYLCGDPYCPSCGNPAAARLDAAIESAMEQFAKADLTPEEYEIAVEAGLRGVLATRKAVVQYIETQAAITAEGESR